MVMAQLHLDEIGLIENEEDQGILLDIIQGNAESLDAIDWLRAGYVIDIPFSYEGACYRIGTMNPKTGEIEIMPVFVPFGSMLVRSNTLFHSGSYGSPGNSRFHGQFRMREGGIMSNNTSLGYARFLNKQDAFKNLTPRGEGWRVRWKAGYNSEAKQEPSLERWTQGPTKGKEEYIKDMKELKLIGSATQKYMAQGLTHRMVHTQSALYSLNPEYRGVAKTKMSSKVARMEGVRDVDDDVYDDVWDEGSGGIGIV